MAKVTVGTNVHYDTEEGASPKVRVRYYDGVTGRKYPCKPYFSLDIAPQVNGQGVCLFLSPDQFRALVEGIRVEAAVYAEQTLPEHVGILTEARP